VLAAKNSGPTGRESVSVSIGAEAPPRNSASAAASRKPRADDDYPRDSGTTTTRI
jgi:hypothetical protein